MNKLLRIEAPLLLSGIAPALENDSAPLWIDGRNVVFRDGAVRPEPGQAVIYATFDPGKKIIGIGETERQGHPILWWGTLDKIFRADLTTTPVSTQVTTQATGLTGRANEDKDGIASHASFATWGEWMAWANGVDEMKYRNTTGLPGGTFANISAIPGFTQPDGVPGGVTFKPHFLVTAGSHLLAAMHHKHLGSGTFDNEVPEGENTIWWCSQNNLAQWAATRANSAGSFILRAAKGPLTSMTPYLDGAALTTLESIHLLRYMGDPLWFGIARNLSGIGGLSPRSQVAVGGAIYGMGTQGFWVTDGAQYQFIDTPMIRDYVYKQLNFDQKSKIVSWHDIAEERIIWWVPFSPETEVSNAVAFSLKDGTWHLPGYVRTAASLGGPFGYGIIGDVKGSIYRQSYQSNTIPQSGDPLLLGEGSRFTLGYGNSGYGGLGYGGRSEVAVPAGTGLHEGTIQLTMTTASGVVITLSASTDTNTLYLESKDLNLGEPDVAKLLRAVRLEMQFAAGSSLTLKIYSRDNLDDPLVLVGTFNADTSDEIIHMRVPQRRYYRLRLEGTSSVSRWKLTAIELFGSMGRKRAD